MLRDWLFESTPDDDDPCSCTVTGPGTVDASACAGTLATAPACRKTAVNALDGHDGPLCRRQDGLVKRFDGPGGTLLAAAATFARRVVDHDETLATTARRDPLQAAAQAAARGQQIRRLAEDSGLLSVPETTYEATFEPTLRFTIGNAFWQPEPPTEAHDQTTTTLPTGATATTYRPVSGGPGRYHLQPPVAEYDRNTRNTLLAAYEHLGARGADLTPLEAVRLAATDPPVPPHVLASVLRKHTRGYGVIEDLFADPAVSDVYAPAPAADNRLWVVHDGEQRPTNCWLSDDGAGAIASRLRSESGQSFSRAAPTVDATTTIDDTQVRVAGVRAPATDGYGFAFRTGGETPFTLPALVANDTLSATTAGLLSVAVRSTAAVLVAGPRGAGKTTLLSALLWELAATTRVITIEDTPELPVDALQAQDRDVQPLWTTRADGPGVSPAEALRTALRLGDSALVLGEVRGVEAAVLYEAMRVGANSAAVLGTIHGSGGEDVYNRVVHDLEVPPAAFGATDLVVTMGVTESSATTGRHLVSIEEVVPADPVGFEPLVTRADGTTTPTGRIDRGQSRLLGALADGDTTYEELRDRVHARAELLSGLARRGEHSPSAVTQAYARWERPHD